MYYYLQQTISAERDDGATSASNMSALISAACLLVLVHVRDIFTNAYLVQTRPSHRPDRLRSLPVPLNNSACLYWLGTFILSTLFVYYFNAVLYVPSTVEATLCMSRTRRMSSKTVFTSDGIWSRKAGVILKDTVLCAWCGFLLVEGAVRC